MNSKDKITQIWIPDNWGGFIRKGGPLLKMLTLYEDPHSPAFFFSTHSVDKILDEHKGLAVMIVNNSIKFLKERLSELKERENVHFISTSKLVNSALDELGLSYIEFPATLLNPTPKPITKGNGIYFYSALGEHRYYGYFRIKKILEEHFPHLEIIGAQGKKGNEKKRLFKNYTRDGLYENVYPKVFLAIRLTPFDGLSGTVQELGLRGIKTIWNGGTPSALSYQSDEDIIRHIRNEEKLIGTQDLDLTQTVSDFLNPRNPKYSYIFNVDTYSNKYTK